MTIYDDIYGDMEEAEAYFANRLHEMAWTSATEEDRRKALIAARTVIDTLNYKGVKASVYLLCGNEPAASLISSEDVRAAEASQPLEFPRGDDSEVPEAIRRPVVEARLHRRFPAQAAAGLGFDVPGIEKTCGKSESNSRFSRRCCLSEGKQQPTNEERDMIAQLPNLKTILKRHEIHPKFWPTIRAFVEEGTPPDAELSLRLSRVTNYRAALTEIMAELSKGLDHEFPPPEYWTPADYRLYESLTPEDVALATSGG